MPDGPKYLFAEVHRKLSLAKISARKRGKDLIDSAIEDIIKLEKLWKKRRK